MKSIKILLVLLFVFISAHANAAEEKNSFTTTHYSLIEEWFIPFPTVGENAVYIDYRSAVKIKSVVCDSIKLEPKKYGIIRVPNPKSIDIGKGTFLYSIPKGAIAHYEWSDKKEGIGDVFMYDIPQACDLVEIEYYIEFPNGTSSPLCKITSMSVLKKPFRDQ